LQFDETEFLEELDVKYANMQFTFFLVSFHDICIPIQSHKDELVLIVEQMEVILIAMQLCLSLTLSSCFNISSVSTLRTIRCEQKMFLINTTAIMCIINWFYRVQLLLSITDARSM
jgi:hypothetical protein